LGKIGAIEVIATAVEPKTTIEEVVPVTKEVVEKVEIVAEEKPIVVAEPTKISIPTILSETKVSAFSLASIKAKKELVAQHQSVVRVEDNYPKEAFNDTDMLLQWNKFAQKLEDRGHMILHSLMMMNDPKLEGTKIIHELPNEGTKIEFERTKNEILGYLRGMLHNHDIDIEIVVNETMDSKRAFTPQDKFNRLKELNPNLELLRKAFDLDV
jgi:hypothetical protein